MSSEPHIVIVGAGFGGLACAKALGSTKPISGKPDIDAPARVTVIDRANYHLFVPLLYQVATAALSPADIARPIRRILGDYRQYRCRSRRCHRDRHQRAHAHDERRTGRSV